MKKAASWITSGKVSIDGTDLSVELTATQKYDILKKYWASKDFTFDQKKELKTKVFEKDDSDKGK